MCGFYHSSSRADCTFNAIPCKQKRKDPQNSNNSIQPQLGPEKNFCSLAVIIARYWALKFFVHNISLCTASCHCFASRSCSYSCSCSCSYCCSCSCCHDPFIMRIVKLVHRSRFHSICTSVSMFTINADKCMFLCSRVWFCISFNRSIIGLTPFILQ